MAHMLTISFWFTCQPDYSVYESESEENRQNTTSNSFFNIGEATVNY